MAYSNFSLQQIRRVFHINEQTGSLFSNPTPIAPSAWLLETQRLAANIPLISEKIRSEKLIFPVLLEIYTRNTASISIFSGAMLDADPLLGLNGECDYILAKAPNRMVVEAPIFCMVEAKKEDLLAGMGQALAQMIGAQVFNRNDGLTVPIMYGCVTTGTEWQFLRLQEHDVLIGNRTHSIQNLPELLGILQTIIDSAELIGMQPVNNL